MGVLTTYVALTTDEAERVDLSFFDQTAFGEWAVDGRGLFDVELAALEEVLTGRELFEILAEPGDFVAENPDATATLRRLEPEVVNMLADRAGGTGFRRPSDGRNTRSWRARSRPTSSRSSSSWLTSRTGPGAPTVSSTSGCRSEPRAQESATFSRNGSRSLRNSLSGAAPAGSLWAYVPERSTRVRRSAGMSD